MLGIRFSLVSLVVLAILISIGCSKEETEPSGEMLPKQGADIAKETVDSLVIVLAGSDSLSVFDILKLAHEVDYVTTASGVFVRGIDSINASDDFFWLFSVNDEMPPVAADRYLTRKGDVVKWHFRRIDK